jgi:hypothetical protein
LDEVHETAHAYIDLRKKITLPCPEFCFQNKDEVRQAQFRM